MLVWPKIFHYCQRQIYDLQLVAVIATLWALLFELWSKLENVRTKKCRGCLWSLVSHISNRLCVNKKVFDGKHKHAKEKRQENGVWEILITYVSQYRYVNFPHDMCFWSGVKSSMTLFLLYDHVILLWWQIYMLGK